MNRNNPQATAQKIRERYEEKKATDLDALRELDAKVKRPANVFAYIFGIISAIIMGTGMSLVMTDIGSILGITRNAMMIGILIGLFGMLMAVLNYPIYLSILNGRKRKYAPQILKLSETIINQ